MVKYEVYEQDDFKIESVKTTRFYTQRKEVAFMFMNEKNKIAGRNIWRVGLCINNRTAFDIDNPDITNIKQIVSYYKSMFGYSYKIIKSLHGYHLIGKQPYDNYDNWLFDECRILNPLLERKNMKEYILAVQRFYTAQSKKERENIDKQEFLKIISDEFKETGLFFGLGDFDILFSMNVLFRGMHCIRISKKCKEDNPEELFLFP